MLVLKPTHSLAIKVKKLEEFLTGNNIELGVNEHDFITVKDNDSDTMVEIRDSDDGRPTYEFPATFEYKLVIVPKT